MKIEILDNSRYEEYESFLLSQEHSLFYHSTKYKDFLEDLLGCESRYLLAYDNNKIVAALPLMIKNGSLGKVVNSLPYYGSNGGIICQSNDNQSEILAAFKKSLSLIDYASLTLVSSPFEDSISTLIAPVTDQRISQITPLDPSAENYSEYIFSIIEGSTRRNIKKAQKLQVKVVVRNEEAINFLEQAHNENMAIIGGKAKSHAFFERITKYFLPDVDYKIYIAELNGTPIAALLVFFCNKTVEYFTPVIKNEFRDYQPLAVIVFEAMKDVMKENYKYWNWGGTWLTQSGVYQFKKKWGAMEKLYNYSTHVKNDEILKVDRDFLAKEYEGFYVYNFNEIDMHAKV
jgi:lipid II:glycine glycyltransferase (peptidoglycan interpeptide bridge formation enzyme)